MNARIIYLQEWLHARNKRERFLLVIVGCAIIYMLWFFLISRPLFFMQKTLKSQIFSLTSKIEAVKSEATSILLVATEYSTNQKIQIQKLLSYQSQDLQKRIETSAYKVSVEGNIEKVLKDILNQPAKGTVLMSFKSLSDEPLIPPGVDIKNLPPMIKNIVKHGMHIQIQSNFHSTIYYLNQLEKLSWRLYWDSLEYKVLDYPRAEVKIKFYILVNDQDG